jgi:hypothetical protein
MQDFVRGGVFVNGRYYTPHPKTTGTKEEAFIKLFPDSHTAGLISNLAAQNLGGLFYDALAKAQPQTTRQEIISIFSSVGISKEKQQNIRIDTLDEAQGRYRITLFYGVVSAEPESAVERYMFEVSVDVDLGAPTEGEGPRLQPKIEDVHLDILFRGREAVPGE